LHGCNFSKSPYPPLMAHGGVLPPPPRRLWLDATKLETARRRRRREDGGGMAAAAVRQPTDTGPAGSGCSGGKVEIGVRVCAWHVAWRGVSGNAVCLCADACVCSHCCDQFLSSVPSKRIRFKMYDLSFALCWLSQSPMIPPHCAARQAFRRSLGTCSTKLLNCGSASARTASSGRSRQSQRYTRRHRGASEHPQHIQRED
jgi:hypothetical protein